MHRAALVLCASLALPAQAMAQSPHSHHDSVTTQLGVYTYQQSQRGSDIYAGNCRSCHTPETHTGPVFTTTWQGRTLADLYTYVRDRMPKNDPGSLSPQEYIDVIAYVLRMNKLPMGELELAADSLALSRVRIQIDKVSH
jgi:hypothetical protein